MYSLREINFSFIHSFIHSFSSRLSSVCFSLYEICLNFFFSILYRTCYSVCFCSLLFFLSFIFFPYFLSIFFGKAAVPFFCRGVWLLPNKGSLLSTRPWENMRRWWNLLAQEISTRGKMKAFYGDVLGLNFQLIKIL